MKSELYSACMNYLEDGSDKLAMDLIYDLMKEIDQLEVKVETCGEEQEKALEAQAVDYEFQIEALNDTTMNLQEQVNVLQELI